MKNSLASDFNRLNGTHQVITAYYPIQPRWNLPSCSTPWIGDLQFQYPMLGLYDNTNDETTIRMDFQAMARAGVTVVNFHMFGNILNADDSLHNDARELLDRLDRIAAETNLMWTPTFEGMTGGIDTASMNDYVRLANATLAVLKNYDQRRLMRSDGLPVFFWYYVPVTGDGGNIAHATEVVRQAYGQVLIILDEACRIGQFCQTQSGRGHPDQWFTDAASTGGRRINGFYQWVSVQWALNSNRQNFAENTVRSAQRWGMTPVLSTTPSYNESSWVQHGQLRYRWRPSPPTAI